jgi:hypothetical protein
MKFLDALKAGQSLINSGGWKVAQNWMNFAIPVLSIAASFVPGIGSVLTPDVIAGIATAVGGANAYLTTATTDKIGLK